MELGAFQCLCTLCLADVMYDLTLSKVLSNKVQAISCICGLKPFEGTVASDVRCRNGSYLDFASVVSVLHSRPCDESVGKDSRVVCRWVDKVTYSLPLFPGGFIGHKHVVGAGAGR